MRWLGAITDSLDVRLSKLREFWPAAVHGVVEADMTQRLD